MKLQPDVVRAEQCSWALLASWQSWAAELLPPKQNLQSLNMGTTWAVLVFWCFSCFSLAGVTHSRKGAEAMEMSVTFCWWGGRSVLDFWAGSERPLSLADGFPTVLQERSER